MTVTYATISGQWLGLTGEARAVRATSGTVVGHIEAATANGLLTSAGKVLFQSTPIVVDASGNASVTLPVVPQDDISPSDPFYRLVAYVRRGQAPMSLVFQLAADTTWDQVLLDAVGNVEPSASLVAEMNALAATIAASAVPLALVKTQVGLRPVHESLAKRTTKVTRIAVLGDSVPEGVLTSTPHYTKRWIAVLQEQIRARVGLTGGVGYMPVYYADAIMTDETTRAGASPTEQSWIWGPGGKALLMPGTTGNQATLTWPAVTCDKVRVYFGKTNVAGGQSKVFIDNVDVTSTGTLGGNGLSGASTANIQHSGGSKSGGYYWELVVAGGSHTVKVQSTANGGVAVIHGVEFFNGDAAAGLHVMDAAHSGARADHYIDATMAPAWEDWATWAPDLTVVMIGINDASSVSAATFKTNLTTLVGKIKTASPTGQILIVHTWRPGVITQSTWDAFGVAKREVAEADSACLFFDLSPHWPALATDGSLNNGLMVESTNPVHPNTAGNQRLADIFTSLLSPFA